MASKKITYTAPNGETTTSTTKKTHAIMGFNPKTPWVDPYIISRHGRLQLALDAKEKGTKIPDGVRTIVAPLTDDGTRDEVWAERVAELRHPEDMEDVAELHIDFVEQKVGRWQEILTASEMWAPSTQEDKEKKAKTMAFEEKKLAEAREELAAVRSLYALDLLAKAVEEQIVAEPAPVAKAPKPKKAPKTRRGPAKTRFIKEVADLIRGEDGGPQSPQPVVNGRTVSTGHRVTVERDVNGRHTALIVRDGNGDFFEFRCPFTADNAGKIATQIWGLMETMGL